MANPAVRYVGTISYGMYLLHMLAINVAKKLNLAHDWRYFAMSLALSIAFASASYWLYERQFLKLKHRFATRADAEPTTADPHRIPFRDTLIDSPVFAATTPQPV